MSNNDPLSHTLFRSGRPDAPKLVLLHPLGLDGTFWSQVISRLAEQADILTVDLRGHGLSPKVRGRWPAECHAEDIIAILDQIGWSRPVVAGASMGGCVALALAGLYPQRVGGLGLIDTTAWYGVEAPERWEERALQARREGMSALSDFQLERWFSERFRHGGSPIVHDSLNIFLLNDVPSYESACRMLGEFDGRSLLGLIECPTVVIVGEHDYATPPEMARDLAAGIRGATLSVLEGVRHFTPLEVPDEIASCLLPLLPALKTPLATSEDQSARRFQ